jgi:hypothetical protein
MAGPLRSQAPDAVRAGDDDFRRQPDKQPVLDDPGPRIELGRQLRRLPDGPERAIEDQITLIGPERGAIVLLSHGDVSPQGGEKVPLGVRPERDHLDRQWPVGAKGRRQLTLIDDDDLAEAGLGDDLLVE